MSNVKYKDTRLNAKCIQTIDVFYAKFRNYGSDDLRVDGIVNPFIFNIEDLQETDFLLQRVSFLIGA